MKSRSYLKIIAGILLAAFAAQEISYAQGGSAKGPASSKEVRLPASLGLIQENRSRPSEETILHIQDAHDSLEAQRKITEILTLLAEEYDVRSFALEGSSGAIDARLFRSYPDAKVSRAAAEKLVGEGKLNAGEFFAVTAEEPVSVYGAEDRALYRADLRAFKTLLGHRAEIQSDLDGLSRTIEVLADRVYGGGIKGFRRSLREAETAGFTRKWEALRRFADEKRAPLEHPNLKLLSRVADREKGIDFEKANDERRRLLSLFRERLQGASLEEIFKASLEYKAGRRSDSDFHVFLRETARRHGIAFADFADLERYTRYLELFDEVDLVRAVAEIERAGETIEAAHAVSADERTLIRLEKDLRALSNAVSGTASSKEFDRVRGSLGHAALEAANRDLLDLTRKYHVPLYEGLKLERILEALPKARRFYDLAKRRDAVLVRNTLKKMRARGQRVAALVTGGFHADGITAALENDRLSHLVILPKLTEAGAKRPYLTILTRRTREIGKALASDTGRYQIALGTLLDSGRANPYLSSAAIRDILSPFVDDLKKKGNAEDGMRRWMEAYRRAYEGGPAKNYHLHPEKIEAVLQDMTGAPAVSLSGARLAAGRHMKVFGSFAELPGLPLFRFVRPGQEGEVIVVQARKARRVGRASSDARSMKAGGLRPQDATDLMPYVRVADGKVHVAHLSAIEREFIQVIGQFLSAGYPLIYHRVPTGREPLRYRIVYLPNHETLIYDSRTHLPAAAIRHGDGKVQFLHFGLDEEPMITLREGSPPAGERTGSDRRAGKRKTAERRGRERSSPEAMVAYMAEVIKAQVADRAEDDSFDVIRRIAQKDYGLEKAFRLIIDHRHKDPKFVRAFYKEFAELRHDLIHREPANPATTPDLIKLVARLQKHLHRQTAPQHGARLTATGPSTAPPGVHAPEGARLADSPGFLRERQNETKEALEHRLLRAKLQREQLSFRISPVIVLSGGEGASQLWPHLETLEALKSVIVNPAHPARYFSKPQIFLDPVVIVPSGLMMSVSAELRRWIELKKIPGEPEAHLKHTLHEVSDAATPAERVMAAHRRTVKNNADITMILDGGLRYMPENLVSNLKQLLDEDRPSIVTSSNPSGFEFPAFDMTYRTKIGLLEGPYGDPGYKKVDPEKLFRNLFPYVVKGGKIWQGKPTLSMPDFRYHSADQNHTITSMPEIYPLRLDAVKDPDVLPRGKKVVLIETHPDDVALNFFALTVSLLLLGNEVHVLSLMAEAPSAERLRALGFGKRRAKEIMRIDEIRRVENEKALGMIHDTARRFARRLGIPEGGVGKVVYKSLKFDLSQRGLYALWHFSGEPNRKQGYMIGSTVIPEPHTEQEKKVLFDYFRSVEPKLVVGPAWEDNHAAHRETNRLTRSAFEDYVYQLSPGKGSFHLFEISHSSTDGKRHFAPDFVLVSDGEVLEAQKRVMSVYGSQTGRETRRKSQPGARAVVNFFSSADRDAKKEEWIHSYKYEAPRMPASGETSGARLAAAVAEKIAALDPVVVKAAEIYGLDRAAVGEARHEKEKVWEVPGWITRRVTYRHRLNFPGGAEPVIFYTKEYQSRVFGWPYLGKLAVRFHNRRIRKEAERASRAAQAGLSPDFRVLHSPEGMSMLLMAPARVKPLRELSAPELSANEEAGIVTQLGYALGMLHSIGLVHGDLVQYSKWDPFFLRTDHIFWDAVQKKVSFIDFGASREASRRAQLAEKRDVFDVLTDFAKKLDPDTLQKRFDFGYLRARSDYAEIGGPSTGARLSAEGLFIDEVTEAGRKVAELIRSIRADWDAIRARGAFVFDLDATLIPKGRGVSIADHPQLLALLADLLRQGIRIGIISGNSLEEQKERFFEPIGRYLAAEPQVLGNLTGYLNSGATKVTFDGEGRLVPDARYDLEKAIERPHMISSVREALKKFVRQDFGIDEEGKRISRNDALAYFVRTFRLRPEQISFADETPDPKTRHLVIDNTWMNGAAWEPSTLTTKEIEERVRGGGTLSQPFIEIRGASEDLDLPEGPKPLKGHFAAIAVRPVPRVVLRDKESGVRRLVDARGLFEKYLVRELGDSSETYRTGSGGAASTDITDYDAGKDVAMDDLIRGNKLDARRVFYFGDEFYRKVMDEKAADGILTGAKYLSVGNDEIIARYSRIRYLGLRTLSVGTEKPERSDVTLHIGRGPQATFEFLNGVLSGDQGARLSVRTAAAEITTRDIVTVLNAAYRRQTNDTAELGRLVHYSESVDESLWDSLNELYEVVTNPNRDRESRTSDRIHDLVSEMNRFLRPLIGRAVLYDGVAASEPFVLSEESSEPHALSDERKQEILAYLEEVDAVDDPEERELLAHVLNRVRFIGRADRAHDLHRVEILKALLLRERDEQGAIVESLAGSRETPNRYIFSIFRSLGRDINLETVESIDLQATQFMLDYLGEGDNRHVEKVSIAVKEPSAVSLRSFTASIDKHPGNPGTVYEARLLSRLARDFREPAEASPVQTLYGVVPALPGDGRPVIFKEFVPGSDLRQIAREIENLGYPAAQHDRALRIARSMGRALGLFYARMKNIPNDLHPGNLVYNGEKQAVKLIDLEKGFDTRVHGKRHPDPHEKFYYVLSILEHFTDKAISDPAFFKGLIFEFLEAFYAPLVAQEGERHAAADMRELLARLDDPSAKDAYYAVHASYALNPHLKEAVMDFMERRISAPSAHDGSGARLSAIPEFQKQLLEGVGERTPDWLRLNDTAEVFLESDHRRLSLKKIQEAAAVKFRNKGLAVHDNERHVAELLERFVHLGLVRKEAGAYALRVSKRVLAVKTNNTFFIKKELEKALKGKGAAHHAVLKIVEDYAKITDLWHSYPVESRWPVLRAVSLLAKEDQELLIRTIQSANGDLKRLGLADSILLMFNRQAADHWLEEQAPGLIGRTIYYVSPETWLVAGGLGRVGQYHTISMKALVGDRATIASIEPLYPWKLTHRNEMEKVDYSKLPVPVEGLKEQPDITYEVAVRGQETAVEAFSGTNKHGIHAHLIKDRDNFQTKLLYRYGPEWGSATWPDFTEFFSRAALKLIQTLEREKRTAAGEHYKSPVIMTNDGQTGLFPYAKRDHDESAGPEDVLKNALVWMVTHTYRNRGIFGYESRFLDGRVPLHWWNYYTRIGLHDATSGGRRLADGTSAVAATHSHEVSPIDPGVIGLAITNGDDLDASSAVFRDVISALYPDADPVRPTAEQAAAVKAEAKRRANRDTRLIELNPGIAKLDPDRIVIGYFGRLVEEKAGRARAFTDDNIRELVAKGAQVIHAANVQAGKESRRMHDDLKALENEVNAKGPGRLIVLTGWSQPEQITLLAATDVQVQDSDRGTEAAGFTESDIAANAGLQVAPPGLEGILQNQGIILDRTLPGSGNTLVPADESPAAYLDVFLWLVRMFSEDRPKFASYQAVSVPLSRVLTARIPAAEYLRQFEKALVRKEQPLKVVEDYVLRKRGAADHLRSEWLRKDLAAALQRSGHLPQFQTDNPNLKAYLARLHGKLRIILIDTGMRNEGSAEANGKLKGRKAFEAILGEVVANHQEDISVVDAEARKVFDHYRRDELFNEGLWVVVREPGIQVLDLVPTKHIKARRPRGARLSVALPDTRLVESAREMLRSAGVGEGKKAVSIGPGPRRDGLGYRLVPWEDILRSLDTEVQIFEPSPSANKQWRSMGYSVHPPQEGSWFQHGGLPDDSVDIAVTMSVFSDPGITDEAKEAMIAELSRTLAPDGHLLMGRYTEVWRGEEPLTREEVERTRAAVSSLENELEKRGRRLVEVEEGVEPLQYNVSHSWTLYRVEEPAGARLAKASEEVRESLKGLAKWEAQSEGRTLEFIAALEAAAHAGTLKGASLERARQILRNIKDGSERAALRVGAARAVENLPSEPKTKKQLPAGPVTVDWLLALAPISDPDNPYRSLRLAGFSTPEIDRLESLRKEFQDRLRMNGLPLRVRKGLEKVPRDMFEAAVTKLESKIREKDLERLLSVIRRMKVTGKRNGKTTGTVTVNKLRVTYEIEEDGQGLTVKEDRYVYNIGSSEREIEAFREAVKAARSRSGARLAFKESEEARTARDIVSALLEAGREISELAKERAVEAAARKRALYFLDGVPAKITTVVFSDMIRLLESDPEKLLDFRRALRTVQNVFNDGVPAEERSALLKELVVSAESTRGNVLRTLQGVLTRSELTSFSEKGPEGARLAAALPLKTVPEGEAEAVTDQFGNQWALQGYQKLVGRFQWTLLDYLTGKSDLRSAVRETREITDFPWDQDLTAVFLVAIRTAEAYFSQEQRDFFLDFLSTWMRDKEVGRHAHDFVARFGGARDRRYVAAVRKIFHSARRELFKVTASFPRVSSARSAAGIREKGHFDDETLAKFYLKNKRFRRLIFGNKSILTKDEKIVLREKVLAPKSMAKSFRQIRHEKGILMIDLPGAENKALEKVVNEAALEAHIFKYKIDPKRLEHESVLKLGPFRKVGTLSVLRQLNIETVADLISRTPKEIYDAGGPFFWSVPLSELREALARHDLKWANDKGTPKEFAGARLAESPVTHMMDVEVRPDESYQVVMTRKIFHVGNKLLFDEIRGRKAFFVVDKGIGEDQIKALQNYVIARGIDADLKKNFFFVKGGERVKNGLGFVQQTLKLAWRAGLDRKSVFVKVGGGAVNDMAGFAASIFHRGADQISIPTTLLAQDDAAIGVKNGVNFFGQKNFLGTFRSQQKVFVDPYFLRTADARMIASGLAEIIKVTLMKDAAGFEFVEKNLKSLVHLPWIFKIDPGFTHRGSMEHLSIAEEIIFLSIKNHLGQIKTDPKETKLARPLDYGHEWGHRLEMLTKNRLYHGEAVAIGMAIDSFISWKRGYINEAAFERILGVLRAAGLPIYDRAAKAPALWRGLEEFRQHLGGELTISLLKGIGEKQDVHELDRSELEEALRYLKARHEGARLAEIKILLADKPAKDKTTLEIAQLAAAGDMARLLPEIGIGKDRNALREVIEKEKPAVVIVRSDTKAFKDPAFITLAKENGVKAIMRAGAGVDNVDTEAAAEAGIAVVRTHGNANSVANLALRFLLASVKVRLELLAGHRSIIDPQGGEVSRLEGWNKIFDVSPEEFLKAKDQSEGKGRGSADPDQYWRILPPIGAETAESLFQELEGKTIGLVGFGAVAQAFAAKLKAVREKTGVSFSVIATSPSLDRGEWAVRALADNLWVGYPGEKEVLKNSDILSLHLPGEAEHYFTAEKLRDSKISVLLNTSRHGVLDPGVWKHLIARSVLYFADVDLVEEGKPILEIENLRSAFPNTLYFTPHIAASTDNAAAGVEQNTLKALDAVLETLQGLVPDFRLDIVNGVPIDPFGAGARLAETVWHGLEKPFATHPDAMRELEEHIAEMEDTVEHGNFFDGDADAIAFLDRLYFRMAAVERRGRYGTASPEAVTRYRAAVRRMIELKERARERYSRNHTFYAMWDGLIAQNPGPARHRARTEEVARSVAGDLRILPLARQVENIGSYYGVDSGAARAGMIQIARHLDHGPFTLDITLFTASETEFGTLMAETDMDPGARRRRQIAAGMHEQAVQAYLKVLDGLDPDIRGPLEKERAIRSVRGSYGARLAATGPSIAPPAVHAPEGARLAAEEWGGAPLAAQDVHRSFESGLRYFEAEVAGLLIEAETQGLHRPEVTEAFLEDLELLQRSLASALKAWKWGEPYAVYRSLTEAMGLATALEKRSIGQFEHTFRAKDLEKLAQLWARTAGSVWAFRMHLSLATHYLDEAYQVMKKAEALSGEKILGIYFRPILVTLTAILSQLDHLSLLYDARDPQQAGRLRLDLPPWKEHLDGFLKTILKGSANLRPRTAQKLLYDDSPLRLAGDYLDLLSDDNASASAGARLAEVQIDPRITRFHEVIRGSLDAVSADLEALKVGKVFVRKEEPAGIRAEGRNLVIALTFHDLKSQKNLRDALDRLLKNLKDVAFQASVLSMLPDLSSEELRQPATEEELGRYAEEIARSQRPFSAWFDEVLSRSEEKVVLFGDTHSSLAIKRLLRNSIVPALKRAGIRYFVAEYGPVDLQGHANNLNRTGFFHDSFVKIMEVLSLDRGFPENEYVEISKALFLQGITLQFAGVPAQKLLEALMGRVPVTEQYRIGLAREQSRLLAEKIREIRQKDPQARIAVFMGNSHNDRVTGEVPYQLGEPVLSVDMLDRPGYRSSAGVPISQEERSAAGADRFDFYVSRVLGASGKLGLQNTNFAARTTDTRFADWVLHIGDPLQIVGARLAYRRERSETIKDVDELELQRWENEGGAVFKAPGSSSMGARLAVAGGPAKVRYPKFIEGIREEMRKFEGRPLSARDIHPALRLIRDDPPFSLENTMVKEVGGNFRGALFLFLRALNVRWRFLSKPYETLYAKVILALTTGVPPTDGFDPKLYPDFVSAYGVLEKMGEGLSLPESVKAVRPGFELALAMSSPPGRHADRAGALLAVSRKKSWPLIEIGATSTAVLVGHSIFGVPGLFIAVSVAFSIFSHVHLWQGRKARSLFFGILSIVSSLAAFHALRTYEFEENPQLPSPPKRIRDPEEPYGPKPSVPTHYPRETFAQTPVSVKSEGARLSRETKPDEEEPVIVVGASDDELIKKLREAFKDRPDIQVTKVGEKLSPEEKIKKLESEGARLSAAFTIFYDDDDLNGEAKLELLRRVNEADLAVRPVLGELLRGEKEFSDLSEEARLAVYRELIDLLPAIAPKTITAADVKAWQPAEAFKQLKLRTFHPSFGDPLENLAVESPEESRAAVWSLSQIISDPFFFEALEDRDQKLHRTKMKLDDHVIVPKGTDLEEILGERTPEFLRRFLKQNIHETPDGSIRSVYAKIEGRYKKENVLFIDKAEKPTLDDNDPSLKFLTTRGEYTVTPDKVVTRILARSGSLEGIFFKGLKQIGNRFFFELQPLDFARQFKNAYLALSETRESA
jgi:3-dehydroquinate synthase